MLLKKGVERQQKLHRRFRHAVTLRPIGEPENAHLRIQVRRERWPPASNLSLSYLHAVEPHGNYGTSSEYAIPALLPTGCKDRVSPSLDLAAPIVFSADLLNLRLNGSFSGSSRTQRKAAR